MKKTLSFAFAGALVVTGALAALGYHALSTQTVLLKEEKIIEIPKGSGLISIGYKLEKEGIIPSATLFRLYGELHRGALMAGAYRITPSMTLAEIHKTLKQGDTVTYNLTIPEGLRSSEVINILINAPHVSGVDTVSAFDEKTYYLPETYRYTHGESVSSILKRMQKHAEAVLGEAWENRAPNLPIATKEELMTLASIVEKETGDPSERARIAGVFVNRLNKGMKLQTDPTVIYGASNYNGNITRKHLKEKHPYNTYVIKGLPPGPICHPGADAIRAAANPEKHNLYYFVATGNGGHNFAKTHVQHQKNVRAYLKVYREKYGK